MAVILGRESYFNKGRYQLTNGNILKWGVKNVHPPISSKKLSPKLPQKIHLNVREVFYDTH